MKRPRRKIVFRRFFSDRSPEKADHSTTIARESAYTTR